MQNAKRWIAIGLMGLTGLIGFSNAMNEIRDGETLLQRSVGFAVLTYGVFGLIGAIGVIRRRPWSSWAALVWAVASVYAGSVASFAFHDPSFAEDGTVFGVVGAGLMVSLMGWFVVRVSQESARAPVASPEERV